MPAYATAARRAVDVDAEASERKPARRLTAPDDPDAQVSREEFDEMVRDLHVDAPAGTAAATATKPKPPRRAQAGARRARPTARPAPEDVVMPDDRDEPGQARSAIRGRQAPRSTGGRD